MFSSAKPTQRPIDWIWRAGWFPGRIRWQRTLLSTEYGRNCLASASSRPRTISDQQGQPTHPELLDWLASEFVPEKMVDEGDAPIAGPVLDLSPNVEGPARSQPRQCANQLLARQSRLRVNAEIVRDVSLAASGLLMNEVGGPSVFPPQPDGTYRFTQIDKGWKPSNGPERYRRGMYTYFWQSAPHPALIVFNAPDSTTTCTRRNRSNTPLQALTLLNDTGFYEYAQGLATRVLKEAKGADRDRLKYAFRLCLCGRQAIGN